MALITAERARDYIRSLKGAGEDTLLDTLIGRAGALMAAYCNFPVENGPATLESATYTHYIDGPGGRLLQLRTYPATAITSIHDSADHDYGAIDLVAASDYNLVGNFGYVELTSTSLQGAWSSGERNIKAVYTAGFTAVPADIQEACGMQTAHMFRNRDNIGFTNISQGQGSAGVQAKQLLPEVKAALAPYRLMGGAIG